MKKFFALALGALLYACMAGGGLASPSMRLGGPHEEPQGLVVLCQQQASVCQPGKSAVLSYAGSIGSLLQVNRYVNAHIAPQNDPPGQDIWSVNVTRGDCEDYALTKRAKLIEMHYPAGALLIAMVIADDGSSHALLVARTDRGDYVLDNLREDVLRWDALPYGWVARMSPEDPRKWQKILPT